MLNEREQEQLSEVVAALCETFGRAPTPATYLGYEMGLEDLPLAKIKHAATRAMRECRFMPTVAELRELTGELSPEARAVLAWSDLASAVETQGAYRSVDFSDSVINATVRSLGGWVYVCELGGDEFEKWLRQRFLQTYKAMDAAGVNGESCGALIGIHAKNNAGLSPEVMRLHHVDDTPIQISCATHRPATQAIENRKQAMPMLVLKSVPS